jgi:hypothetical protein
VLPRAASLLRSAVAARGGDTAFDFPDTLENSEISSLPFNDSLYFLFFNSISRSRPTGPKHPGVEMIPVEKIPVE